MGGAYYREALISMWISKGAALIRGPALKYGIEKKKYYRGKKILILNLKKGKSKSMMFGTSKRLN